MPVSFDNIPKNIRVPFMYVEFNNSGAVRGASLMPYRHLVIGQKLATGTVEPLTPTRVTSAAQAQKLTGKGSMLAGMLEKHFQNNKLTETLFIALDDNAAGQKATGSVLFAGPVSSGTLNLYVGGRRVQVGVAASDTLDNIATKTVAVINALASLPATAVVNGANAKKIDITFNHKGESGNDLDIRVNYYDGEDFPVGLTATVTAMSGGASNPDLSPVWAALGDDHYHVITCPYTDAANLVSLETELADRWGPMRMIEGIAISAAIGTHSRLVTLGNSRNSPHLSIMNAAKSPTPPWEWAAVVAAVTSYHGNIDPARPFQTLPIVGILPPASKDRFTQSENNLLLYDGIATHMVDAGDVVRIQRLITTYEVNAQGAEDISYLDVNTPLTLGFIRFDWRNFMLRKYPRHKLADDGTKYGPGQAVITPKVGKAEAIARFRVWEEIGLVENIDQFKNEMICERDQADPNRLNWYLPPDLVNQFRIGATQIGFLL